TTDVPTAPSRNAPITKPRESPVGSTRLTQTSSNVTAPTKPKRLVSTSTTATRRTSAARTSPTADGGAPDWTGSADTDCGAVGPGATADTAVSGSISSAVSPFWAIQADGSGPDQLCAGMVGALTGTPSITSSVASFATSAPCDVGPASTIR